MIQRFSGALVFLFCFLATGLFADSANNAMPSRDQGLWQTVIMVGIALMFFYFILWRPEQKRRKEADQKRDALKKGDKVTAMWIICTVSKVQEHTVIVKMVDGAKIEFLKAAISDVIPASEAEASKSDD